MNILSGMMGMGGGYGGRYSCQMRAYSAAFIDADSAKVTELNHGGKILLPNSTLDYLVRYNVPYPMLFKVSSLCESPRATNCGVLEFSAPEGKTYLPRWMMKQLRIEDGAEVRVDSVTLPSATYAKLKPQSLDFLNISNPRAVLEVELRKFACLTKNDIIAVMYADQVLEFLVQEVKPSNAVCIIECDLNLDFDAPEGYIDESMDTKASTCKPTAADVKGLQASSGPFSAFSGSGQRLDGKKKASSSSLAADQGKELLDKLTTLPPVVCNADYKPGKLNFIRYDYKSRFETERELQEAKQAVMKKSTPFGGSCGTIRKAH
ncbi:ubiquitin fusion degradation protein UFD1 [Dictyocaulus viviparus]|uniref:Ubiquitin fusion degradation protein UFD1 n=1 Tax=Dictyocaulus viviparus TaxID=29172 RepID=A0A0D8Y1J6_DICVI|nr:ubiquitin fusion degradation protein UFD1 [Dictyocaulus viviparus]